MDAITNQQLIDHRGMKHHFRRSFGIFYNGDDEEESSSRTLPSEQLAIIANLRTFSFVAFKSASSIYCATSMRQ